jgi:hypothetical protein
VSVEQSAKLINAALIGSVEDGADRLPHLRRMGVARLQVAGENLDRFVPAGLGDLVNGAPVGIGRAGVEAGGESAANRVDIARAGRVETRLRSSCAGSLRSTCALSWRQLAKPYSRASAS